MENIFNFNLSNEVEPPSQKKKKKTENLNLNCPTPNEMGVPCLLHENSANSSRCTPCAIRWLESWA
jgi:hypothetical protein